MGLAGTRTKQRFGNDPRNTNWSNDTSRFGHQYLASQGWKQGTGLGLVSHATTSHVKVSIKTDNAGLGASLARRRKDDGKLEEDGIAGLDAFQRILGRLNGMDEDEEARKLDDVRRKVVLEGKWGMRFVKGETLGGTWDMEKRRMVRERDEKMEKKRKRDDSDEVEPKLKKSKKEKKEKKEKKSSKEKKEKKDKKEKKSKEKKEKKDKKSKEKKDKLKKEKIRSIEPSTSASPTPPPAIASRLSARSKWIKQKRASVMDSKALNEIFMVSN